MFSLFWLELNTCKNVAFPSIFVSSLREFPENYVYKHDGPNRFIEYLHRKLLLLLIFSLIILKGYHRVKFQLYYSTRLVYNKSIYHILSTK
jgi:hypothetical protein